MKNLAKVILLLEIGFFVFLFVTKFSLLAFLSKKTLNFNGEKSITINDDGLEYQTLTAAQDVAGAIVQKNIDLSNQDEIIPAKNTEVLPGMFIFINRPASIKISVDAKNIEKQTFAKTVFDALAESSVTLSHLDKTEPALETRLSNKLEITVTRIKTEEVTNEEPIDFQEVKQNDNQVDWGEKKITQTGEEGIRETTYRIDYENGEEVKRTKLASNITKSPVNQIVKIGTRLRIGKTDSGVASWYNAGKNECAYRTFSPGTWLRVTNQTNGRQVFVRVAGYGPQEGTGKLIDLDNAAFKKIAPLSQGTTKVKVEEILNKGFSPD